MLNRNTEVLELASLVLPVNMADANPERLAYLTGRLLGERRKIDEVLSRINQELARRAAAADPDNQETK